MILCLARKDAVLHVEDDGLKVDTQMEERDNHDEDDGDEHLEAVFDRALNKENQALLSPTLPSLLSPMSAKVGKNYDEGATDLYHVIEGKAWEEVIELLKSEPTQAGVWIFRNEKNSSKLRWRLLPIHAAIIFKAPVDVIEALLNAFPSGALSVDDQGMVPLHLAFRHGAPDTTLYSLVSACPEAIDVKDRKGRVPIELHRSLYVPNAKSLHTTKSVSGLRTYVAAAIKLEKEALSSELSAEFNTQLQEMKAKHEVIFKSAVEDYEDQISTLRKEKEERLQLSSAEYECAKAALEKRVESLEQEMTTARLASESLIYRFDQKCQIEENLKVALTEKERQLKEMTKSREHADQSMEVLKGQVQKLEGDISHEIRAHNRYKEEMEAKLNQTGCSLEEQVKVLNDTITNLRTEYSRHMTELEELLEIKEANLKQLTDESLLLAESNNKLADVVQEKEDALTERESQIQHFQSMIDAKGQQISYLQEQNEILESLNKELKEKLQILEQAQTALFEAERRLSDLTWEKNILESSADELKDLNKSLKASNCDIQRDLDSASQKIVEQSDEINRLTEKNDLLEMKVEELKSTIETLQASCENYKESLALAEQTCNGHEIQLKNLSSEKEGLDFVVRDLRESIEQLQRAKGELEDKLQGATLQIVEQNDLLQASTHDRGDVVEELKSLKLNYQNILIAKNECENDLRQATQRILEQESSLQEAKAENNKMTDDTIELNKLIETLQISIMQYQVNIEVASQKIQHLESKVAQNEKLESYSRELKSTVEKLQGSKEEYEELLESANKTILEQEAKIHVAQSVREDAMSMYHMKAALAEKLQNSIDEYKEKLKALNMLVEENAKEISQAKASSDILKVSYENKCADVASLEERLAEKEKELVELRVGLDVHQNITESKFSELACANTDLKKKVKDLTTAAARLPEVTEKLEAAERKIFEVTEVSKVKIAALEQNVTALDQLNNELTSNSVVLEEKLKEMAEKLDDTERRYSLERDHLLEERSMKSLNVATNADKVAVLEKITNKLQEKVNALTLSKAELEEAAKERDSLRYLIELLQANLDKETYAKEELRKEVNNLKADKSDLSKQLKFLEQTFTVENKALKKELEGLMSERNNSTFALKDLENLQEVNADLKSKVKHLEQTNAYINMRLRHLSKKDANGETPEKQLNSYIEVRQRMLDAVEKQVKDVQEKAHMSRLHISEFTKKPSTSPKVGEATYTAAVGGYQRLTKVEGSDEATKHGI